MDVSNAVRVLGVEPPRIVTIEGMQGMSEALDSSNCSLIAKFRSL